MKGHNRAPTPSPRSMVGTGHEDLRRGPWTLEEDNTLSHYISSHGEGRWNVLAKFAGLKRTGKSCRLRWLNYLKPDIKRGKFTPQEQILILELHSKLGNRWSKIARNLPGRTDNEIKNYWRTRVQRQARQLNIEPSSKRFLEAIRCFWNTEQPHSSSSISGTTMNPHDDSVSNQPRTNPYTLPRHQQQPQQAVFNESVTCLGFESFDGTVCSGTPSHGQVGATSASDFKVAEPYWLVDNMGDCMWDMDDEMWQLDI